MDALKLPLTQGGMSFTVTANLGISLHPNDGAGMDELVRRADAAMRDTKLAGRAAFRFHRARPDGDDEHSRSRSRLKLDHAMRLAQAQGRFRLLGVKLAIDAFGTGYSSLASLKRFPSGRLKIDRSFVSGLPAEESDVAIVQAMSHMGGALRLQTVAEGVETEAQREFLAAAGCDVFQSYLFAPALHAAAFEARVAA